VFIFVNFSSALFTPPLGDFHFEQGVDHRDCSMRQHQGRSSREEDEQALAGRGARPWRLQGDGSRCRGAACHGCRASSRGNLRLGRNGASCSKVGGVRGRNQGNTSASTMGAEGRSAKHMGHREAPAGLRKKKGRRKGELAGAEASLGESDSLLKLGQRHGAPKKN
jgi:hypothetical protein